MTVAHNEEKKGDNRITPRIDENNNDYEITFEVTAQAEYFSPASFRLSKEQPVNISIKKGKEFDLEVDHINKTVKSINDQIQHMRQSVGYTGKYAVIKGGDDGTEAIQLKHAKSMSQKHSERLKHMYDLSLRPYEFRVDIVEGRRSKTYYLGPEEIEKMGSYSVYSYHDNRFAEYLRGTSKKVLDEVELRRQYSIKGSRLLSFKNTYVQSEDSKGIVNPYLLQILQERRKDYNVKNIVASIQKEQDEIVNAPSLHNMIIQGCAGSGKTMIMMQRLSRLQNYMKTVDAYDVVIITPSKQYQLFMRALTEGLAIQRMLQNTLEDYYNWILSLYDKDFILKSDNIAKDSSGNLLFAQFIYSDQFREYIIKRLPEEYLKTRDVLEKIAKIGRELHVSSYITPENLPDCKLWETLQALVKLIRERLENYPEDDYYGNGREDISEWKAQLKGKIDSLQDAIDEQSPINVYKRIYRDAIKPILKQLNIKMPRRHYKNTLYARLLFCKAYYSTNPETHSFICIDEGQDISINEYKLLGEICGLKSVFNIYGDIHQNIYQEIGVHDWHNLSVMLKAKNYVLEENYRNTNQIISRCNKEFKLRTRIIGLNGPEIRVASLKQIAKFELKRKSDNRERWAIIIPRNLDKRKL